MNKFLVSLNSLEDTLEYKKVGIDTFLFAMKGFSVGYEREFSLEEINAYKDGYVLINRLLDCDDIEVLRRMLPNIQARGIVYEDIGVFNLVKELGLDLELIFFQNHFGSNVLSINYWLSKGVDSMFVCNELTKEEILYITKNASSSVVVQVLGYNQVMYSRRYLLKNYAKYYNIEYKNKGVLEEKSSKIKFRALENDYGTVLYSEKIFNGLSLVGLDNVKYYFVNTTMMDVSTVIKLIMGDDTMDGCDDGFLQRETVFKVREVK